MSSLPRPTDDSDFLLAGMSFVASSTDAKETVRKLVAASAASLGSDMGSFFIISRERGVLVPYVTLNLPDEYLAGCSVVELGDQCCGRAALHKLPWIVEDMWSDPLFSTAAEGAKKSGIRAALSMPVLAADGECLGSLAAHFRDPFKPNLYQLERQSLFAKLIGFALVKHGVMPATAAKFAPAPAR